MKNKQAQVILNKAQEKLLSTFPNLLAIYVFGSFGTQYEIDTSDLDLALISPTPLDPVQLWYLAQEIARKIDRDVDLVDLREASTVFRFQVITNGSRIYCRNKIDCDFLETSYISMYLRLNEERKEMINDIWKIS
jgi:predicted nucleotidyltransferase